MNCFNINVFGMKTGVLPKLHDTNDGYTQMDTQS